MEKSRFKISQNGFSKVQTISRFLETALHSEKRLQDFLKWVCPGVRRGCEFSLLNHSKTRSLWTY